MLKILATYLTANFFDATSKFYVSFFYFFSISFLASRYMMAYPLTSSSSAKSLGLLASFSL